MHGSDIKNMLNLYASISSIINNDKTTIPTEIDIEDVCHSLQKHLEESNGNRESIIVLMNYTDYFERMLKEQKDDDKLKYLRILKFYNDIIPVYGSIGERKLKILSFVFSISKRWEMEAEYVNIIMRLVFDKEYGCITDDQFGASIYGNNYCYVTISSLISHFLSPNNLQHLKICYAAIRTFIIDEIEQLMKVDPSLARRHEMKIVLALSAFQSILFLKGSIIVMVGLSPSLFEFFIDELCLGREDFAVNHPNVFRFTLSLLCGHLKQHNYFIEQSSYFIEGNGLNIGEGKRDFLRKQLLLLNRMLTFDEEQTSDSIKALIGSWSYSLCKLLSLYEEKRKAFVAEEWNTFYVRLSIAGMLWRNDEIQKATYLMSLLIDISTIDVSLYNSTLEKLQRMDLSMYGKAWDVMDYKVYLRQITNIQFKCTQESEQHPVTQTSFGLNEFVTLSDFLLKSIYPDNRRKKLNWLDQFLYELTSSVSSAESDKQLDIPIKFLEKSQWLMAQMANFCVKNKMKTPFGKPMETFNAFSGEINRLAKEVLAINKKLENREKSVSRLDIINIVRVRLLLEFVDVFEKIMSSAMTNGSSFNFINISNISQQFFTTNAQSCNEWLLRTYYPSMIVAFFNGHYGLVVRFGWSALLVYSKKTKDEKMKSLILSISCWMGRAMTALAMPQPIIGMSKWIEQECGGIETFGVFNGLVSMAENKFEKALIEFEYSLNIAEMNDTLRMIVKNAIIDLLNRIRLPSIVDYYRNILFKEDEAISDDFKSVELLTKFEKIENKERSINASWSIQQNLMQIESKFSQTMKMIEITDLKKELGALGSVLSHTDKSCNIYADCTCVNFVVAFLIDNVNNVKSKNCLSTRPLFNNSDNCNTGEQLSLCRRVMQWAHHLKHPRRSSEEAHLEIVKLARKSGNKRISLWHINSADMSLLMRLKFGRQKLKLAELDENIVIMNDLNCVMGLLAHTFSSTAEWKQNAMMQIGSNVSSGLINEWKEYDETMSRTFIQCAQKYESSPDYLNFLPIELRNSFLWNEVLKRASTFTMDARGIIGALYLLSSEVYPQLAKSHLKLAKWAYEMAKVHNIANVNQICAQINSSNNAELNMAISKCLDASSYKLFESELQNLIKEQNGMNTLLLQSNFLANIWKMVDENRQKYFRLTASSYFSFIQNSVGSHPYSKNEEIIGATLRILELLGRNDSYLMTLLEVGLSKTVIGVWKQILPQLFSRLSHPSENVRNVIVNLISRIGEDSPHAVVFQIVAGAASFIDSVDNISVEEERHFENDNNRYQVKECCEKLERSLHSFYPELVTDVKKMMSELEMINLLNEERWALVLGTVEHEIEKRFALIRSENTRTSESTHLAKEEKELIIAKKTQLMTNQLFEALDELYNETCVKTPRSENERKFQSMFGNIIKKAWEESTAHRKTPEKSWAPYKSLVPNLVNRNVKQGLKQFDIKELSGFLNEATSTHVPLPGQDSTNFDDIVFVSKVSSTVTVLPTKTKPKKLSFIGSDGVKYSYLLKGREDLHLDERVMQFLRLCNIMLESGKTNKKSVLEYKAHNYAVIPLGPRSGLIKWVEGATPLFHIYRKWQHREKLERQKSKKVGEKISKIEKPCEMYNKMIRNVFTKNNIDPIKLSDRSKWPAEALKEVYEKLVEKTPKDLLSRELWIRSGCALTWFNVTSRFARTCAVMSMIGSIIGLGDRHLDNLLVDLNKGNLVHIDYNICFDKGRNLRVPETVPFRLTQNIVHALGPSFTEGIFRESCVHTLSVLREGKDILSMLLDAFVYDPLVDWTTHENGTSGGISLAIKLAVYGYKWENKTNDVKDAYDMFKVRMREYRSVWLENMENLKNSLKDVDDYLKTIKNEDSRNRLKFNELFQRLQAAVTCHFSISKDLRPLVRIISCAEPKYADYYENYKKMFSVPLKKLYESLRCDKDYNPSECMEHLGIINANIDAIFQSILELPEYVSNSAHNQNISKMNRAGINQADNKMARRIVETVESRLDGIMSCDESVRLSPEDQANKLISDAASSSNLSLMYEGWTSWV